MAEQRRPDYSDDISLTSPVGHTVTFNGAIDGQAGIASAVSLTVAAGVTFDITHHSSVFFSDDLHNDGLIDVLDSGLSIADGGTNTGTIDVHGTSGFISSLGIRQARFTIVVRSSRVRTARPASGP